MTTTEVLLAVCLLVGLASGQGISNSGNDFSIMFPPNLGAVSPNYPPIIFVTTDDPGTVSFTVSYNKRRVGTATTTTHTAQKGALTRIELPPGLKDSFVGFSFDSSVNVVAASGKNVIVYALNEDSASTDVFLALPKFETKTKTYNYYGVSVPKSPLEPKPTFGYMALVILEANTVITLTGTVALGGFLSGTPLTKQPGVAYTSRPLAKGTTILLRSADDLTGSKISSNVPVTVITGHQCGFLPGNVTACDHLTEQVPPAETWGFKFILVPLLQQTHDGYKVLASRDGTVVKLTCVNADGTIAQQDSLNLNDQQFQQLYIPSKQYCTMESNNPILVMQIALSHSFSGTSETDPFMTMVPPVGQYRNDYTLLFVESFSVDTMGDPVIFKPHMSISVPNECFNREQILFDDQPFPESVQFLEVRCDNGKVCGHEAQYEVPVAQSRGAHTLKHSDSSCSLGVIVYGYERENTYGYPGGMNLDSIAVPNFCFKDAEAQGSECDGVLKFTLQNTGVAEDACVTFTTTDGTADSGVDFMVENSECCFEDGAKEVECEIKVLSDSLDEGVENFSISLVAKAGQCVCDNSLTAEIFEALAKPKVINFGNTTYCVEENAGTTMLKLVLEEPEGGSDCIPQDPVHVSVQIQTSSGSATEGSDYIGGTFDVTFMPGSSELTVVIPIVDDELCEKNETFTASIVDSSTAIGGNNNEATVIIKDNEEPSVSFVPVDYEVNEDAGNVTLMLMASCPVPEDTVVTIMTTPHHIDDGSATDGEDYIGGEMEVTIKAGSSKAKISKPIINDEVSEGNETFHAEIVNISPPNVNIGPDRQANVKIIDDDKEIDVFFSPVDYEYSENEGFATLTVMTSCPVPEDTVVTIMTTPHHIDDGSATDDEDYIGGEYEVTIKAGSSKASISIPIINDTIPEGNETFHAEIVNTSQPNVNIGQDFQANVTIIDDDKEIMVFFSPADYEYSENEGIATLMVMTSCPATKDIAISIMTADSSAMDLLDYISAPYECIVKAGEDKCNIAIPLVDDTEFEGDESFTAEIVLSEEQISCGFNLGSAPVATVTILDDDVKPVESVNIEFGPKDYEVNEIDGCVNLTLKSSTPVPCNVCVMVNTQDGSATGPDDYLPGPFLACFKPNTSTTQVKVTVYDDKILDVNGSPNENFMATFTIPRNQCAIVNPGRDNEATVEIVDHEKPVVVNFDPVSYTVSEDGMFAILNLSANCPAIHDYTIQVDTMDGTAESDSDYDAGGFTATFPQGAASTEVYIPIINDMIPEAVESFTATISVPEGSPAAMMGVQAGDNDQATVTVIDDDSKTVNFNPTAYTISEDGGSVVMWLVTNNPVAEKCTIQVQTTDGSAQGGADYIGGICDVVFEPGSSRANVTKPIIDDNINEIPEMFTATIVIPPGAQGVQAGVNNQATVEIEDNDRITVEFDPTQYEVDENGVPTRPGPDDMMGSVCLTLTADRPSSTPYTVVVDTQDGSATASNDYAPGAYDVTFNAGETKSNTCIPLVDDDESECEEDFFGQLRIPGEVMSRRITAGAKATATIVVQDTCVPVVSFEKTEHEVFEADLKAEVCLVRTCACRGDQTIRIGTNPSGNISASAEEDYQDGPHSVEFSGNSNRACVEIPVTEDENEEGPEKFQAIIIQPNIQVEGEIPFQKGPESEAQVTINDGSIDGDPMFTVPLSINKKMLSQFTSKDQQWDLCYEVHGREEKIYNLVSDQCVSVNTHLKLASNPKVGNIMSKVAIVAMDRDGRCHRILADLTGKTLRVNDQAVKRSWLGKGIVVHRLGDKIDVAVPNCQGQRMTFSIQFHYMNGANMIKFTIADGRALSPSSHGLIGQFWNAPVEIQAIKEKKAKTGNLYKVIMHSSFNNPRSFIGEYYPITWGFEKTPCLYAGTKNGFPVIEGDFKEYEVQDLFDAKFGFSQFSMSHCKN